MGNSSLVVYTKISPNSSIRTAKIDTITIHHMGSTALSIEACGAEFARKARKASANYGVGSDGRIGLYVEESRRSWCSSNWKNDNRAVTIEVANDTRDPDWHVSDAALEATIALCTDICIRNNIPRLNYTGDTSGNLTMHKWFGYTGCPGPYLSGKFSYIAEEVNRRLGVAEQKPEQDAPIEMPDAGLQAGDIITLVPGSHYTSGKAVPDWVLKKTLYCRAINGCNVTFSIYKTGAVTGITAMANVRKGGQAVSTEPVKEKEASFLVGDAARLKKGARYVGGKEIPAWVIGRRVYVRQIYSNGNVVFSVFKSGAVTGTTTQDYLENEQGGESYE